MNGYRFALIAASLPMSLILCSSPLIHEIGVICGFNFGI